MPPNAFFFSCFIMLYFDLFFSYDLDYHLVKLNDYDDDRDDGHTIINTNAINNTLTSTIPQGPSHSSRGNGDGSSSNSRVRDTTRLTGFSFFFLFSLSQ